MRAAAAVLILAACWWPARAADHRNLEAGIPVTVEGAYPIKHRERTFEGVLGYQRLPGSTSQGGFLPEIEYGFLPNWQFNLGAQLVGRSPGASDGFGNVEAAVLHNFNTETLRLPAFALKAEAEFPTGVNARGVDLAAKAILTKTLRNHRVHLNAGPTWIGSPEPGERSRRWEAVAGWDRPVTFQSLLVADFVVRESERRGDPAVTAAEVGLRLQMTPQQVLSFGVGVGLTGRDRQRVYFTVAVSRAF